MPTVTGRATDFITFSRTSNATVTGADGKIKWAGHNLLPNSESFDASAWTKSSATVTANSEAAPNGTTTGDTIAASGANGTALQSYTALAVPYTFGVWLKRKTGTGTIEIAADNGTYTAVTITSSWALYTVTQTPAAGSKSAGIRIVTSGDEVYAWGAHLYRSDLGGMVLNPARGDAYYPTTPRNLLGFTESLTTGWTNSNTTDSIVTETNPNGLASSVEVTATAGNGTLLGSLSLLASPYTFSIWLKRKTGTGTVEITVDGTTYVTAAVTSDWQRFSTTLTPSAGTKTPGIRLVTSGDAVYAWGAQLSDSASLDAYSPVYGAAVTSAAYYAPRLDYDPVTLAARGLLVEEQRTNLLAYSEQFDNAYWVKSGSSVTANAATAPDGQNTADRLNWVSGTIPQVTVSSIAITSGTPLSVTCFMKAGTKSDGMLILVSGSNFVTQAFDLSSGAVGATQTQLTALTRTSASIQAVGNGWYRCQLSVSTTGITTVNVLVRANTSAGTGDNILVWGAQLEAGSFATSYIPTLAASATRTADVASVSTQAFPYSASEGTIVVNAVQQGSGSYALYFSNGNETDYISARFGSSGTAFVTATSAVLQANIGSATSDGKTASCYKVNDFAVSTNGAAVATDISGTVPPISQARLGAAFAGGACINGHIRQVTYLPRRISNTELQQRAA